MHYKNGREVKVGDKLVGADQYGNAKSGIVIELIPGTDTCNANIVPMFSPFESVTLSECMHADDFAKLDFSEDTSKKPETSDEAPAE